MKKITLILIISALFFFVSAAAVIADGEPYRGFSGVYEMIARGNALISTKGFTETDEGFFVANEGSHVWGTIDMAFATWIFKPDGTGTAQGRNFAFDLPPGHPTFGPRARDNIVNFKFKYKITRDGAIYVRIKKPKDLKPLEMEGMVSEDRKTITLHSEYVFFNPNTIFMASRVLIRVQ